MVGMDRANYAHLEAGRRRGTSEQIVAIARSLQIPVDALLGPDDPSAAA